MTGGKENSGQGASAGICRPLLWSATAHLLAALSLVVLATDPAAGPFPEVVKVTLVGPSGKDRQAPGRQVPGSASGKMSNPIVHPAPAGVTASPSARENGEKETAAVEHPRPAARDRDAGATVIDAVPAPFGETPSPEGPPPDVSSVDAGARPAAVTEGERVAPVSPRASETERSGEGTGHGREDGGQETASGGETGEPVASASGPAASFPDPGGEGAGTRTGSGTALLRERIQSRLVYPAEAVRRGQQGEVLLRIRIDPGGVPGEIRIARSSGVRILDDAARRGVVRATPLPSAPGWVEVPVRFRLR